VGSCEKGDRGSFGTGKRGKGGENIDKGWNGFVWWFEKFGEKKRKGGEEGTQRKKTKWKRGGRGWKTVVTES